MQCICRCKAQQALRVLLHYAIQVVAVPASARFHLWCTRHMLMRCCHAPSYVREIEQQDLIGNTLQSHQDEALDSCSALCK